MSRNYFEFFEIFFYKHHLHVGGFSHKESSSAGAAAAAAAAAAATGSGAGYKSGGVITTREEVINIKYCC